MARIKAKTAGVVIEDTPVDETVEASVEEAPEIDIPEEIEEEISIEEVAQKSPVKGVRICPSEDHSCSIGGVRYYFKKGVCQNVPVEVKEILVKAGLLSPL